MVVVTNLTSSGLKKPPLGGFFVSAYSKIKRQIQVRAINFQGHKIYGLLATLRVPQRNQGQ